MSLAPTRICSSEDIQVVSGHDGAFVSLLNFFDQQILNVTMSGAPPALNR
jgi:hypothetical protein